MLLGLPEPALVAVVAYGVTALLFAAGQWRATVLARRGAPRATANREPPSVAAPARVVFLGDVQRGVREVAGPVVDVVRAEGASLLVSGGDLASHGEAPYHGIVGAAFDRAGLAVPFLVVPGNHDLEPSGRDTDLAAGRALFERVVGPRRWTAHVGRLLLVGTDDAVGAVEDAELDWLERVVGAHDGPWVHVAHRPPRRMLEPGAPWGRGRERLASLFAAKPPVLAVSGHLERDAEAVADGVRFVVNAEGGDVSGGRWRAPPGFRVVVADVSAEGAVTLRRLDLRRRLSLATALDQLLVRLWADGRRFPGLLFAAPARALAALLRR